jgi:hypothetical protein
MALRVGQYRKVKDGRTPEDALLDLLEKVTKDGVLKIGAPGPFAEFAQVRRASLQVIGVSDRPDRVYAAVEKALKGVTPREWGVNEAGATKRVDGFLSQLKNASQARATMLEIRRDLKGEPGPTSGTEAEDAFEPGEAPQGTVVG